MSTWIPLGATGATLVDDCDADLAMRRRWRLATGGYAFAKVEGKTAYLHRLIANAPTGLEVDHINGDKLDNRRANLRLVTRGQNEQNRRYPVQSATGIRNVVLVAWRQKPYRVRMRIDGRIRSFGYFATLEAARAAAEAARLQHMPCCPEANPGPPREARP